MVSQNNPQKSSPACEFLIGVSGGSGSGKTTFCRALVERLGEGHVLHLKQDHYYRDLSHLSPTERDAVNFDHPQALEFDLLCEHLRLLRSGLPIEIPFYDFATHTRSQRAEHTVAKRIVIVEGILIFSQKDILQQLHHSVFVETPEDVRLSRRIRRDVAERGRTQCSVEKQFYSTVAPMHNLFVEPSKFFAHQVISGEEPFDDVIEKLALQLQLAT